MIGEQCWDADQQREVYLAHEAVQYAQAHSVPLWVGEVSAPYNGRMARSRPEARAGRPDRRLRCSRYALNDLDVQGRRCDGVGGA